MKPEGQTRKERREKEQKFIVAPEMELALIRARQRLAITLGTIALLLLIVAGVIAFLLLQSYRQGMVQTPISSAKPNLSLTQMPSTQQQLPLSSNVFQLPHHQETPSVGLGQIQPTQQPLAQPQALAVPEEIHHYLKQLEEIEKERKRMASDYWHAFSALNDLLKALQGVASEGSVWGEPKHDPQKTLQTYDDYIQRFSSLRQRLHQLKPPADCQQLHLSYDQALLAHINSIGALKQYIVTRNLTGAIFSGLTAQNQIDTALRIADDELESVCQRYGIAKPFTIGDNR